MAKQNDAKKANSDFKDVKPEKIESSLDPHLQRTMMDVEVKKVLDPAYSNVAEDGTVTLDVMAKLADPQQPVPGLNVVRTIGQIVTGTAAQADIDAIANHANVLSLQLARKLYPTLEYSVAEIQASPAQLQAAFPAMPTPYNGAGVIVGVIDYGCDFVHNNFRNADGSTRLLYLWDQTGGKTSISPTGFPYGREFSSIDINQALQSSTPYNALQYNPQLWADEPPYDGSHGTHVMDIAAGNGNATGNRGVAPKADLIFVNIAHGDTSDETSFGNSRKLMEAAEFIFVKAAEIGKPAVINISLGTNGGPHDGSTLVEQWFDALLEEPGRAIVISAGNSWGQKSHTQGTVQPGTPTLITWIIPADDKSDNELEVWYDGNDALGVRLIAPDGTAIPSEPLPYGYRLPLELENGVRLGTLIHNREDDSNGDNQIDILFSRLLPYGNWQVELTTTGSSSVPFHAWIERDNRTRSIFSDVDNVKSHTIGSISCGKHTLAVGSYLSGVPDREISSFSSEGPTRDGKQKPEVSAPGQYLNPANTWGILAAKSATQSAIRYSGTSMAAPHVVGLIALLMQVTGSLLSIQEIREAVMATARRNPPTGTGAWHPRYGMGRVDATAALLNVVGVPAPAHAVSVLPAQAASLIDVQPAEREVSGATSNLLSDVIMMAVRANARVRFQIEAEPLNAKSPQDANRQ